MWQKFRHFTLTLMVVSFWLSVVLSVVGTVVAYSLMSALLRLSL